MRRGLKFGYGSNHLSTTLDVTPNSPMRRGLKSAYVSITPGHLGSHTKFPDEEGTEIVRTPKDRNASYSVTPNSPMRRGLKFMCRGCTSKFNRHVTPNSPMRRGLKSTRRGLNRPTGQG